MKIKYFQDTDTLYIELRSANIAQTRDLDENTLIDLDDIAVELDIRTEEPHQMEIGTRVTVR